jgi:GTP cyclohydrolase IIa
VSNVQLTLVQIDNYGPWTVTPHPRAEMDLQTLQSRLYADIAQFVGSRGGYIFFTRFDNMVMVTNGLDADALQRLQRSVANRFPVTVSLATAHDQSPVTALEVATAQLQAAGSAQDQSRTEVLTGDTLPIGMQSATDVHIAHFDVNDATGRYTDQLNAYDTFIEIEQAYASLMRYLRAEYDGLSFFVGGDNMIAVVPDLDAAAYADVIGVVEAETGVVLKVGVGTAGTAQAAGYAAKHALEECRATGDGVVLAGPAAAVEGDD